MLASAYESMRDKCLIKLNADHRDLLGSGAYGRVYPIRGNDKRCVKAAVYEFANEITALVRVHARGQRLKNVVRIYDIALAKDGPDPVIIFILMERLNKLSYHEVNFVGRFRQQCDVYNSSDMLKVKAKDYVRSIQDERERKFCKALVNGAHELAKLGIDHIDAHCGNIMASDKGVPKFVDLGLVKLTKNSSRSDKRVLKTLA